MTKALLIDLDGTLADSLTPLKAVFFRFLRGHGIEATDELFADYIGASLSEIISRLKERFAIKQPEDVLYKQYEDAVLHAYGCVLPMPAAAETLFLAKQKGLRLAVVTAANEAMTVRFLELNHLRDVFDALVCARPGEPGKPFPDLYLRALQALGVQSQEAIAVEDSVNGVKAALAAGCEVFWLTQEDIPVFDERVYLVQDWLEIKKWVAAL